MWGRDFDCDLGKRKTAEAAAHVSAATGGRQWGLLETRDVAVMRHWGAPRRGGRNTKWSWREKKRERARDAVVTPHAHRTDLLGNHLRPVSPSYNWKLPPCFHNFHYLTQTYCRALNEIRHSVWVPCLIWTDSEQKLIFHGAANTINGNLESGHCSRTRLHSPDYAWVRRDAMATH